MVSECKSWVYKKSAQECYLKNNYNPSENTIKCDDCMAYNASGSSYVYQTSQTVVTTYRIMFTTDVTTWTQSSFGTGGRWSEATGSTTETCTFEVGFDQPARFNLEGSPLAADAAYKCCDACNKNNRKLDSTLPLCFNLIDVSVRMQVVGMEGKDRRLLPQEQLR